MGTSNATALSQQAQRTAKSRTHRNNATTALSQQEKHTSTLAMQIFVKTLTGKTITLDLYLWHWPLWCFQGGSRLNQNSVVSALMLTIIAIALAAVSTEMIEQPFRSAKRVGRKSLWIVSGIVWTALLSFSIAVHVLEVGGSNKTIAARVEDGLNSGSTIFVPTGSEPESFFLEDANPELFSVEGLEESSGLALRKKYNDLIIELTGFKRYAGSSAGHNLACRGIDDRRPGFDECPGAEEKIVYNKARDPPCLAFFGNSHLGQHVLTIASLAKEYDVSYLHLARSGRGNLFGGCDSRPLPASPWDEQRIRILKQWKPKG